MPSASSSFIALLLIAFTALPATTAADGGVSLNQTRVVFYATDKAQTVTVKNTGAQSYLIQSRIQRALDNQASTPFIVTPPLFQLGPERKQLLRILKQDEPLPTDRESLFYLSVLAIPAQKQAAQAEAHLSMGFRFAIKLFYRPESLKIAPLDASCRLELIPTATGVRIANPTPYFLTFASLKFDGRMIDLDTQPTMIAPMSTENYPAKKPVRHADWQTITDFGGLSAPCQQALPSLEEQHT
ncbi:fimbrial biogenesis chaperone [Serratia silvae]|uniref:Molecular chaperone n=1 Tax=Serratia silvae TaxID=2824122 RepID=A0ABT0K735_9GAMM|nr:molecular chaperone [Serratia silvae]MCL1027751.1 molecular chaperone [Serratia silvae]